MNPFIRLAVALGDRVHHTTDAEARAYGLEVTRLPDGRRIVRDPRVAVYAERRRARILRDGPDPLDRALMDAGTRAALAATADRLRVAAGGTARMHPLARTAAIEAAPAFQRVA